MSGSTFSLDLPRPNHIPSPSRADWPSVLYLLLFIINTLLIVGLPWSFAKTVLIVLQGFFFVGLLEMTHQCVHYAFIATSRKINEAVGLLAASLIGINMVTYRFFHLEHHRHTCDNLDPEGHLYADSPKGRWFVAGAPIAHIYVALGINQLAGRYVPESKKPEWWRARVVLMMTFIALAMWAYASPLTFVQAYLIPLCLFAWFDFLFSQAEHFGAPIRDTETACNVASVSYDITVNRWMSHLLLNRNLHRVHHVWPRTRWFEAQARLNELAEIQPGRVLGLLDFCKRWWADGPRLWQ